MKWKFWKPVKEAITEWFSSPAVPVNASAFPASPADGLNIDRLVSILSAAKEGDCDDLFALYGDIVSRDTDFLAGGLQRKAPRVIRRLNAKAPGKKPGAEALLAQVRVREALARMKGTTSAVAHLMDSHTGWPVAFVEKIIAPAPPGSGRFYDIVELREVPFWRITSRADGNGPAGVLKIKSLDANGMLTGQTELPTPIRYITHRGHLNRSFPDTWGGPLRAVVFWWYFGNWARQACAKHLEKTNAPKWIATAPKSDFQAARRELQRAFARGVNTDALIIPEDARVEAISTLKGDSVQAFIDFMQLCQKQILKVVAGQTSTVEAQPMGLGSSQSKVQADALDTIGDFDGALLSETLSEQLFRPILELNGWPGPIPGVTWGEDEEAATLKADQLESLDRAGLEVDDAGLPVLSEMFGLPLRRKSTPALALSAFTAAGTSESLQASLDTMAARAAEDFTAAFGADSAGIAQALRTATGPRDLVLKVQKATAGLDPHRSARILEDCMAAAAANGLFCSHTTAGTA
jgi:phage gp29-like protein